MVMAVGTCPVQSLLAICVSHDAETYGALEVLLSVDGLPVLDEDM